MSLRRRNPYVQHVVQSIGNEYLDFVTSYDEQRMTDRSRGRQQWSLRQTAAVTWSHNDKTTVDDYTQFTCCFLVSDSRRQDWYVRNFDFGKL